MNVARAVNIEDLRRLARRRLPRILFDWIDGGAGDESALRESVAQFEAARFSPRYLRDVAQRSLAKSLFGVAYDLPFGVSPIGYAGLFWTGGELAMIEAARRANAPLILSGNSVIAVEEGGKAAAGRAWYQLYPARDIAITQDIIARAQAAAFGALVVTVDLPVAAKRERDIRNGFSLPIRYDARRILDGLLHPAWSAQWLAGGGLPTMGTWARYAGEGASAARAAAFSRQQSHAPQTWAHLAKYREWWKGKLVVKGLQHPDDARRAREAGCDGVIISNHGGRQFDRGLTPLESLPAIRDAVGGDLAVMIDGGVRRGADILVCLAKGADFVFCGRAILYGMAAGGLPGTIRAFDILADELSRTMGQIGLTRIEDVNGDALAR